MTDLNTTPTPAGTGPESDPAEPTPDAVLAARASAAGAHIAGLIAAAELDTAGTPRKLPLDLWPDVDPVAVMEIWSRALAVGVRAGQFMGSPRFYRDRLATLRGQLDAAGFEAMGRAVGPVLSVAQRAPEWHPADGEFEREH